MARVRQKDTRPEITVRRCLHALGYRFRLHRRDLPGTPDIVLPKRRKAIFVHGCFWHRHPGCPRASMPKTRIEYWETKFRRNVERDQQAVTALQAAGWEPMVIWECQTRDLARLRRLLIEFCDAAPRSTPQTAAGAMDPD